MKKRSSSARRGQQMTRVISLGHDREVPSDSPRARHRPTRPVLIASRIAGLRRRWRRAIPTGLAAIDAADWGAVEQQLLDEQPSALLLDLRLLNSHGVERLAAIRRLEPDVKIIILTAEPDDPEGVAALRAGAHGYCDRNIDPRLLGKALADALGRRQLWIGRKLAGHVLSELTALTEQQLTNGHADSGGRFERLPLREREVAQLVGEGATDVEVAELLDVPLRAVRTSVAAILRQLHLRSRMQLALVMMRRSEPRASDGMAMLGSTAPLERGAVVAIALDAPKLADDVSRSRFVSR
jgi:DNA-binding NarL/FixJ family response regulator